MVLSVKEEYARKERQLAQTQAAADRARAEAEATRSQQAELVKEKAAQAYSSRKEALEREYQGKTLLYQTFLVGCLLYGLLTTVFTAVRSTRFRGDFIEFFTGLWSGVCWLSGAVWELGQAAAGLGDKIPQPVAAAAVHWLLLILVVGGIAGAVLGYQAIAGLLQGGLCRHREPCSGSYSPCRCRVLCRADKGYSPHQSHFIAHSGTRCIHWGTVVCDGLETSQRVLLKLWTGCIDTPSFWG